MVSILDVICPATSLRRQQAGNRQTGRKCGSEGGSQGEDEEKYHVHVEHLIFKTLYHLQSKLISVVQRGV